MMQRLIDFVHHYLPAMLNTPERWDSLIVNRRKPHTYRVFTILEGGERLCLHKFDPCSTTEAFMHPHPWPGAFLLLEGMYEMWVGHSPDRTSKPVDVTKLRLHDWSAYEITDPLTWHSVTPLTECWTVMLNGPPWPAEVAHANVVTTKGKDLDKMLPEDLDAHLGKFRRLVSEYRGD